MNLILSAERTNSMAAGATRRSVPRAIVPERNVVVNQHTTLSVALLSFSQRRVAPAAVELIRFADQTDFTARPGSLLHFTEFLFRPLICRVNLQGLLKR